MNDDIRFPYQDATLTVEQRVDDLLGRMELEDKAGLLFQPLATVGDLDAPGMMSSPPNRELLQRRIRHVSILTAPSAREIAEWHNAIQREVRATGLGIPMTVASDPRNSFNHNPAAALVAGPFSQWPEMLGFAALEDVELVERFADTVRREYLAVGLRTAIHPQLDLATEPRWCRAFGTFGSDADLASRLGAAYVRGLQGSGLGAESVSAMVKHFPGGGAQKDGEDPHFAYGREQVYPGGMFELHLQPFAAAIAAGAAQIMPYYSMPVDAGYEEVGFAFNKQIITGLLRERLGFDGVVCSDYSILSDQPWGVEELSYAERMLKALDAGIDQFGGEFRVEALIDLVRSGRLEETRLDESVRRLLRQKFRLGLFDDPFVDPGAATTIVGGPQARAEALRAQEAAMVLLTNAEDGPARLPLAAGQRIYVEGLAADALRGWATVVPTPQQADVALVRLEAPWEQRGKAGELSPESFFRAGSLAFHRAVLEHLHDIASAVPTVVEVSLDRPVLLGELLADATTLIVDFGASDEAVTRVVFGAAEPSGRLPFEIPASMAAVEASRPDVPNDTIDPVFPHRHGLRYLDWSPVAQPATSEDPPDVDPDDQFAVLEGTPVGELMDVPERRAILVRHIPELADGPVLAAVRALPLGTALTFAAGLVPEATVADLRRDLADLVRASS